MPPNSFRIGGINQYRCTLKKTLLEPTTEI